MENLRGSLLTCQQQGTMGIKKNILVVDDEEGIRITFEFFLSNEGYDVSTAESYDECLVLLMEKEFDVIVADIFLGEKTGFDLISELRARNVNCPVLIITGDPTAEGYTTANTLGAIDYIPKPVLKDTLLNAVSEALNRCG